MSEPDNCCTGSPGVDDGDVGPSSPSGNCEEDGSTNNDAGECERGKQIDGEHTSSSSAINTNYDSSDGSVHNYCKCDGCEYESGSQSCLEVHLGVGDGRGKLFSCDVCGMKFSNGANMRRHRMRHTGVKPYECRTCQKRFFRKDHLVEHQTTHSKALPYHCPICNKGFQRQIAMRAHFQNEHVGQNDVIKSCPLCNFIADTMKSLRAHFINRHGIDLDNPATGATSSPNCAEAVGHNPNSESPTDKSDPSALVPPHFLAPHIEISMATSGSYGSSSSFYNYPITSHFLAKDLPDMDRGSPTNRSSSSNVSPPSDSNSNLPSSSNEKRDDLSEGAQNLSMKQEPADNDEPNESSVPERRSPPRSLLQSTLEQGPELGDNIRCSSSGVSLIKVSPLKSLLRDDLKRTHVRRRDCAPLDSITSTNQESYSMQQGLPKRMLQCMYCGIIFPDQTLYFLHKGCHSENNPWKCNICGEQCSNLYDFNSHLLSKTHE